MRMLILIGFIVGGALIGLAFAVDDDWAVRAAMVGVGMLFAAPIGAALTRVGRRKLGTLRWEVAPPLASSTAPQSLAANYWRDKGYPPLMKPSDAQPDAHAFEPDRLG